MDLNSMLEEMGLVDAFSTTCNQVEIVKDPNCETSCTESCTVSCSSTCSDGCIRGNHVGTSA